MKCAVVRLAGGTNLGGITKMWKYVVGRKAFSTTEVRFW